MNPQLLSDGQPVDPSDERLVAYLDGELDIVDRDQLEQELVDDVALRTRLQELQRGWDLLDELPDATPSEKLVETTMELVISDLTKASRTNRKWWQRVPLVVPLAVVCSLSAALGYGFVELRRQAAFDRELDDLRLVENLDAYLDGSDLKLMRTLAGNADWRRVVDALKIGESNSSVVTDNPAIAKTDDQRLLHLSEMPDQELGSLAAAWASFQNFNDATRAKIRRTAETVSLQTDADELLATMKDYSLWKASLPTELIDAIEGNTSASPIEGTEPLSRDDAIEQAITLTQERTRRESSRLLSESTIKTIMSLLEHILKQRLEDPASPTSIAKARAEKWAYERYAGHVDHERIQNMLMAALTDDGRPRPTSYLKVPGMNDKELELLEIWLPSEDLRNLDILSGDVPMLRASALKTWAAAAVSRSTEHVEMSVLDSYRMLSDGERQRYDLGPPEGLQRKLTENQRDRRYSRRGGGRSSRSSTTESDHE